ncbi:MAG: hypothetical protein AAGN35_15505 [Bacteroidota bacterium]
MKSIATILLIFLSTQAFAQLSISCTYREVCLWNDNSETFEDCKGYEENSLFKINPDETMFIHTTETIQSAYYINEKEVDEESGVMIYSVESDVGNEYVYFFDLEHDEIRVAAEIDGEMVMIRFMVKKAWTKKERSGKKNKLRELNSVNRDRRM